VRVSLSFTSFESPCVVVIYVFSSTTSENGVLERTSARISTARVVVAAAHYLYRFDTRRGDDDDDDDDDDDRTKRKRVILRFPRMTEFINDYCFTGPS